MSAMLNTFFFYRITAFSLVQFVFGPYSHGNSLIKGLTNVQTEILQFLTIILSFYYKPEEKSD